ncbi:crispr-associated protein Cas5, tneap subtype [Sulfurihydrogenibium azorense Az-Fu1]|uniref:Crispr-associated protein Cas5, tneap subtype n=1 Tax=Sulfurihydrogenibium azorense (strain DSM 15241 / OCM 825 / Az-Fu1) TaxID=204536 RepID=C1DUL8_SULAA|nr:type I-B CRISPR-associated protein Cas5b [Sulfurihydrogenibium azorense]ACN99737.1 crispr-associated protein Cas5, tneap subtype [Sulfurihydrogenibium azorense Az-Fu1]
MKLLKIKAYQIFANYRKPMSFNFWDSYPLPPLSTVRGWFHTTIGVNQYIPIAMSIQGKFSSVVHDLQTLIKFDRKRDKERGIFLEGFNKVFSKSPTYVVNIYDISLTIYLKAKEEYLKLFKENLLKNEYPSLGRKEDLVRIDYIDFIEPQLRKFSNIERFLIKSGVYLNKKTADLFGLSGINYRMNFKYDKELLDKTGLRYFEKKDVVYVDSGTLKNGEILFDEADQAIIDLIGDE